MDFIDQQICSCEDWVRAADCLCSFEGSKPCSFRKGEVVALRYEIPVELLTSFIWGNTSLESLSGQLVPVFNHSTSKEVWGLGFLSPPYTEVECPVHHLLPMAACSSPWGGGSRWRLQEAWKAVCPQVNLLWNASMCLWIYHLFRMLVSILLT